MSRVRPAGVCGAGPWGACLRLRAGGSVSPTSLSTPLSFLQKSKAESEDPVLRPGAPLRSRVPALCRARCRPWMLCGDTPRGSRTSSALPAPPSHAVPNAARSWSRGDCVAPWCRPCTYVRCPEVDARASPVLPEPPPLTDGQPVRGRVAHLSLTTLWPKRRHSVS